MPPAIAPPVTLPPPALPRGRPLDTAKVIPGRALRRAYRVVQPLVEGAFGFPALWRLYDACVHDGVTGPEFARALLARVGVTWNLAPSELADLRALRGPLVVAANHPHGGLDALVMMALLEDVRPGCWRLFANEVLCAVPEWADRLIAVDPLGQGGATRRRNAAGMVRALRHLRNPEAVLGLFPAGRVSHRHRALAGSVCDRAWNDHAVRLAAKTGATLVCLHFSGANSARFLAVPPRFSRLRALMLCRELTQPSTRRLDVRLAAVLPPADLRRMMPGPGAGARLRARCYLRADQETPRPVYAAAAMSEALCAPVDPDRMAHEVARLGDEHRLLRSPDGEIDVLLFEGRLAPALLQALGRAREATFRDAGQGSGLACDLSPEDDYYRHLVLWHRPTRSLMGAYRLGFTRDVLAAQGPGGLYLDHIFAIDPRFYQQLGPSIELSRSFVLPEHQRDNRALALLWRGLGSAAIRHGCTTFFGCVTVSNDHHPATRALLVEQLRRNHADDPALCRLVRARRPFVASTRYHTLVGEAYAGAPIEALAPLVDSLEEGARGIPPLMRYYCSLGAKFLAYHVEPSFKDALYCLLRVDLRTIPGGYRRRFLG